MRDVDWSRPPVLVHAVNGEGEITDDLGVMVEGEMILTMRDGTTRLVSLAQALAAQAARVRT